MSKLLISNARLVNEGAVREADVLIEGDRIARIDAGMSLPSGAQSHRCGRQIPVARHDRRPGAFSRTRHDPQRRSCDASRRLPRPAVSPVSWTCRTSIRRRRRGKALTDKYAVAEGRCTSNYGFYLGATNGNIEEIKALQVGEACGIKAFMGASTGDMLVDDPEVLEQMFEHAPVMVVTHCEHSPTIWENEAKARADVSARTCRCPSIRKYARPRPVLLHQAWPSTSRGVTMPCCMFCI